MHDIPLRLCVLIAKQFNIRPDRVPTTGRLNESLPFDSLETVELVLAIESEFDIEISDFEVGAVETFDDLVACVRATLDRSLPLVALQAA